MGHRYASSISGDHSRNRSSLYVAVRPGSERISLVGGLRMNLGSGSFPRRIFLPTNSAEEEAAVRRGLAHCFSASGFGTGVPGNFAFSSFHRFTSSGLFVASASSMSRSRASTSRTSSRRDLLGALLHSLVSGPEQGSASANFFWPSRAPPSIDFVLNVDQTSGSFVSRIARASRRTARRRSTSPVGAGSGRGGQGRGVLRRIRAGFALAEIGHSRSSGRARSSFPASW